MTLTYLIRHGTNDLQERGILAGWTPGICLNEKGRTEAQALAQRLTPAEIAAVYSSPLERALETAEIVAGPHKLQVMVREGLGEVRFGRWEAARRRRQ